MSQSLNSDLNIHSEIDPDLNCFNRIYSGIDTDNNSLYYDSNSLANFAFKSKNDFTMIHVNIRSILNKLDEFLALVSLFPFDFDAFCFSEVWLDDNTKNLVSIPGYIGFHSLRPVGKRGGGVSIFVRNSYRANLIRDLSGNTEHVESIFLELKRGIDIVLLGNIYKPPHVNELIFNDIFSSLFSALGQTNKPIFLSGDFNIDILHPNSSGLLTIMNTYLLQPVIRRPTRITDSSMTLIDNIFVSFSYSCLAGIFCSDISDHLPIFLLCKNIFSHSFDNVDSYMKYRLINDFTIETLCNTLENINFAYCSNDQHNVSDIFSRFYEEIFSTYSDACPIKTKLRSFKRLRKPWISHDLLLLIKKRQAYFILYKKGRISKEFFTNFRNSLTSQLRDAKKNYFNEKFNECRNSARKTWSLINNILRPDVSDRNISEIKFGGQVITDSKSMAEIFNNYFSSVGKNIADSIPSTGDHLKFMSGNFNNSFFVDPTNAQEVFSIISNLKPKSCNSIHEIPVLVLKSINHIICHPLSHIVNHSFSSGTFPETLKLMKVIPIPKQGDLSLVENFRPISLLNTFSKIFEKLVYKRLYSYLDKYNILYSKQFGFRTGKSTSEVLISNLREFYKFLDKGNLLF